MQASNVARSLCAWVNVIANGSSSLTRVNSLALEYERLPEGEANVIVLCPGTVGVLRVRDLRAKNLTRGLFF